MRQPTVVEGQVGDQANFFIETDISYECTLILGLVAMDMVALLKHN